MILIDYSSTLHRMIHHSILKVKPQKIGGKYNTNDFIGFTKYLIMQDLFSVNREHRNKFGNIVICLDKSANGYWRKDVLPTYKSSRKKSREESDINFAEVFSELDGLTKQIKLNLPWKVIEVDRAEADDIMLVLARLYNSKEKILLYTPDKDMIQAQRDTDNVFQYSPLTKKWIVPENKHDHMEAWILEHVCLGDAADEVPKVVDHTEFSGNFLKYLEQKGYNINSPNEFKLANISENEKVNLLETFDVYKTNRKGESTGVKDVYKDMKFGPASLKKQIEKHGSLDDWLDSHPLYRKHYDRNFKLVMEEGIPENITKEILNNFNSAKIDYNPKAFEDFLKENGLKTLLMELPIEFKLNRPLCADDFGW